MTNYETIVKTLTEIDNQVDFSVRNDTEIVTLLRNNLTSDEEPLDTYGLAEFYAFSLLENSPSGAKCWNTYFGSPSALKISGEMVIRIPIEKITCEIIEYWKRRVAQSTNPLLMARYAGLVWDLEQKICNTRPDYYSIAIPYISNLIASVRKGLVTSFPICREKLRRAAELSVKFKNDLLKQASIEAIFDYQETKVKPTGAGTWRMSYDVLVRPGIVNRGSNEYTAVIEWLEGWFDKACLPDKDGRIDVSSAEAVFEPLLEEFIKFNEKERLETIIQKMHSCYEYRIAQCNAGEAMHWLEKMREYYLQANLKAQAEKIDVRITELGPRLIAEMKKIGTENTFSKDAIDHMTEEIMSLPQEKIFKTLSAIFILDTTAIMKQKQERGINIFDLVSKSTYSKEGRKVATIGNSEDERESIIQELRLQMTMSSMMMHFILLAGIERNILTTEAFTQFIKQSAVISPNRYGILEEAYKAWLQRNYVVSIHLLIPQIEAACLIIAKQSGTSIYKDNKYGGYNVRLFGDLLRESVFSNTLGTHGVDYFMTLFTDPRGFNLRNEVAHGLRDTDGFDENMANATLIALFHLVACTTPETQNFN